VFLLGSEKVSCSSFIAEFLSPRVSRLRVADRTAQEFSLDVPDAKSVFSAFLCLGEDSPFHVTERNRKLLQCICRPLGNVELLDSLSRPIECELSVSNVSGRLRALSEVDANSDEELDFVASHK
jgi:hypothetical protein